MMFLPDGRALATRPGRETKTPPEGGVGAPMVARFEPYRPRCRAGVGTLAAFHQVAGRFVGPEPSAPLWILIPRLYEMRLNRSIVEGPPHARQGVFRSRW